MSHNDTHPTMRWSVNASRTTTTTTALSTQSFSKMARVEGKTVGAKQGGNKRGRRCAQYRNRATTNASGRAQDRIPVLLLPLNCWLTTCKVARIGRGVGPFGEGTATSMCTMCTIDNTHKHTNVQHTHTHACTPTTCQVSGVGDYQDLDWPSNDWLCACQPPAPQLL
jgi:hypothetical protein